MSQDQIAGQSHNIKTDSISFEKVEELKYFVTALTNHNSAQEEMKTRLNSGNACCYSVQSSVLQFVVQQFKAALVVWRLAC
jgi:hypothetical protein